MPERIRTENEYSFSVQKCLAIIYSCRKWLTIPGSWSGRCWDLQPGRCPLLRARYDPLNLFDHIPALGMETDAVLTQRDTLLDDLARQAGGAVHAAAPRRGLGI